MKTEKFLLRLATGCVLLVALLSSCSKDKDTQNPGEPPVVHFASDKETINATVNSVVKMEAFVDKGAPVTHSWAIGEEICSSTPKLEHTFKKTGTYILNYVATNSSGTFKRSFTIHVLIHLRPIDSNSNAYVTTLFEYKPAPGQFINGSLGDLEGAEGILGQRGMVTLGAWGGYIVLGFDHTVINQANKPDIMLYGNAMTQFAEPGIIWVMQDENGDGWPNDTWYELAGSEFGKPGYERNYSVTYFRPSSPDDDVPWLDSKGERGAVLKNEYHEQAYYPEWIKENSYKLEGAWLKGKIDQTNPHYILSLPYEWGYADNTVGGDALDIANAVDSQGNKVALQGIDFIKVQCAVMANMGWLGECSTEVTGITDMSLEE